MANTIDIILFQGPLKYLSRNSCRKHRGFNIALVVVKPQGVTYLVNQSIPVIDDVCNYWVFFAIIELIIDSVKLNIDI